MPDRTTRRLTSALITIAALSAPLLLTSPASATPSSSSPDTVESLTARLNALQSSADQATAKQQTAAEKYAAAATAQQSAQQHLDDLHAQTKRAKQTAADSAATVAALTVQLSRTGGGDLTTSLLTRANADDVLYQVGTMSHLSERSDTVLEQARADQRTVTSLAGQAETATTALTKATEATKTALDDANTAAVTATLRVADEQERQATVLQQLASIKGTTVAAEQTAWEDQQAQKAEAQLPAKTTTTQGAATAPSRTHVTAPTPTRTSTNTAPTPSQPVAPTPTKPTTTAPQQPTPVQSLPPVVDTPAASKVPAVLSYARAQIGKRYVLGGAGPTVFDCSGLVQAAYATVGVSTGPHNVVSQYRYFASIGRLVPLSERQPGDILFYSEDGTVAGGYHDSIYTGNGRMVEAANPNVGVVERAIWWPNQLLPYVARPTGAV